MVQSGAGSQLYPLASAQSLDAAGINETLVADYYNFAKITTPVASVAGTASTVAAPTAASFFNSQGSAVTTNVASQATPGASTTVSAPPVLHGPVWAQQNSLTNTSGAVTATYNLYVDPGFVQGGSLNSVGLTFTVPSSIAQVISIQSLTPATGGAITQVNTSADGSSSTYQWASTSGGITDFSQPIAQATLSILSPTINKVDASITNLSVNNVFAKTGSLPTVVSAPLNSQVYTLNGTIFSQYNPNGASTFSASNTPYTLDTNKKPIPATDFDYVVQGSSSSTILMNLNTTATPLVPVTSAQPNTNVSFDLVPSSAVASSLSSFSMIINLPSNASAASFTAGPGVKLTTNTNSGHLLTIEGTYAAGKGAAGTPTIGTMNVSLTNQFNTGSQFTIDSVSVNGAAGTGQSVYFGAAETAAPGGAALPGSYTISNLPAGQMSFYTFNNTQAASTSTISVNDAMAALSIAAGRGLPQGPGKAVGLPANLIPSDFIASDWNQDKVITASDALGILGYVVSANKAPLSYTYIPASANTLTATPETVTNVVYPAIKPISTAVSIANGSPLQTGAVQTLDLVGVLNGDIVLG